MGVGRDSGTAGGREARSVVPWRPARDPDTSDGHFPPVEPGQYEVDGLVCTRDIAATLTDGTVIYVDQYRLEAGPERLPVILCWGTSGKRRGYARGGGPLRGVPSGTCSAGTMGEGPDPDYWCRQGYIVVNADPPGIGNSQGDARYSGREEGRDCADLITWIGQQEWCNGSVGMAGNSYFAMVQLFAAAHRPPNLRAIAPWETRTDIYRQMVCEGGIPEVGFTATLSDRVFGRGLAQDVLQLLRDHPLDDAAWEDKRVELDHIEVPVYLTASWSHFNLVGSLRAFRDIGSTRKWLRIYRDFEWVDAYTPENLADQRLFFDRYLKGIHNGWELTPPVRLDVMDIGARDAQRRRPEATFPLRRTAYQHLYLDADRGTLSTRPPAEASSAAYVSTRGELAFDYRFAQDTEITGYLSARLWIEIAEGIDADVFVLVKKLDRDGTEQATHVLGRPHPGVPGRLRASHRATDPDRSSTAEPWHLHTREQPLTAGKPVALDIALWPTSRNWRAGEILRLHVCGRYAREEGWFEPFRFDTRNAGRHTVFSGPDQESFLLIPTIPARASAVIDEGLVPPPIPVPPPPAGAPVYRPLDRAQRADSAPDAGPATPEVSG